MIELGNNIISLSLFVCSFLLEHLEVFFVTLLLLSNFSFIVFDSSVIALLCTLTFLLKTSFESITLDLEKALQLEKLLLRFLLHLTEGILKVTSLLIKLLF